MGSTIPLVIVVTILAVTAVAALVAAFVKERRTFAGYEQLQPDILMLKSRLNAEVFRDGSDVVISGTQQKLPIVVRFSYAENTPGMNIRLHGPSTMNLVVIPKNSQFIFPENVRIPVPTQDEMFNIRYLMRTDDGSAARMFLMGRATMKELQKAMCSSRTTLNITHGSLELIETIIPEPATGQHVVGHIESLVKMSDVLAQMPGAQLAVVEKPKLPKRFLTKTAIGLGAAAALLSIIGAARELNAPAPPPKPEGVLAVSERGAGVMTVDAPSISQLENYRVVNPPEMSSEVTSWLHNQGVEASGRVPLELKSAPDAPAAEGSAAPELHDVAYLLMDTKGKRRLVILKQGRVVFDGRNFDTVSIARVPKDSIPRPDSSGAGSAVIPDGDGILVALGDGAPEKSFVLFMSNGIMVNRPVAQWASLDVR